MDYDLSFLLAFISQISQGCCVASRYLQPGPALGALTHSLIRPSALVCSKVTIFPLAAEIISLLLKLCRVKNGLVQRLAR